MAYGEMLRKRRVELEITLRDFALLTHLDVGYISRIERETIPPPEREDILDVINVSLELDDKKGLEMKQQAMIDKGKFPKDLKNNIGFPLFIKTVSGKRLTGEQLKKLTDLINENY
jgi:transcriptional regulator with XRE-family HTH domain